MLHNVFVFGFAGIAALCALGAWINRSKRTVKALTARYGEERLLRSRINGYIRLFERLLDSLADMPGGSATIDDVLASQNGEVYLMLAETSGRVAES